MNNNGTSERHWFGVFKHISVDILVFGGAFALAFWLRFEGDWNKELLPIWPGIVVGAVAFGCVCYIMGLYALQNAHQNIFTRACFLTLSQTIVAVLMLGYFYITFSGRIGRGVLLIGGLAVLVGSLMHHAYLLHKFRNLRERVALIVTCIEDELEAELFCEAGGHYLDVVGIILYDGYVPTKSFRVLGRVGDLNQIANHEELDRVLCTNHSIHDPSLCRQFCQLRYSGITVMPLISVFEEICQCIPVEMITPEWLLSASGAPRMLYIRKLKRAFDIVISLAGLMIAWPVLFLGMIIVKLASPEGSVFYRQIRSGRFGRPFTLLKLRTMKPDAESGDTAVWAKDKDPRAIPFGNFLRRYRIDEIPQMWNVLRGEMSFVGPRPERPEFVRQLSDMIPFYQERLLIQPGITGWAQVNHPYGASVADARHKLEYDLYYAKNMSLILDVFVLLDTVRIILRGGLRAPKQAGLLQQLKARQNQTAESTKESGVAEPAAAGSHNWVL